MQHIVAEESVNSAVKMVPKADMTSAFKAAGLPFSSGCRSHRKTHDEDRAMEQIFSANPKSAKSIRRSPSEPKTIPRRIKARSMRC